MSKSRKNSVEQGAIWALNAMNPRFGKPAEADHMQSDTEGVATHIFEEVPQNRARGLLEL